MTSAPELHQGIRRVCGGTGFPEPCSSVATTEGQDGGVLEPLTWAGKRLSVKATGIL